MTPYNQECVCVGGGGGGPWHRGHRSEPSKSSTQKFMGSHKWCYKSPKMDDTCILATLRISPLMITTLDPPSKPRTLLRR